MPRMRVQDINVYYRDQGDPARPALVLVHGLGCSLNYWACVFDAPEFAGFRIIALDLPGFGRSEKPETYDYQLTSQAGIVFDVLERLQVRDFSLVGHSMGGSITILMAFQQPQRIRQLLVIEPNLRAVDTQLSRKIVTQTERDFIARYEEFRQSAIETVKGWFVDLQPNHLAEYIDELLKTTAISMYRSADSLMSVTADPDFLSRFTRLALPTHLLVGAETLKVRPIPTELQSRDFTPIIVPGVGHMMMMDNPALFARTLADTLAIPAT